MAHVVWCGKTQRKHVRGGSAAQLLLFQNHAPYFQQQGVPLRYPTDRIPSAGGINSCQIVRKRPRFLAFDSLFVGGGISGGGAARARGRQGALHQAFHGLAGIIFLQPRRQCLAVKRAAHKRLGLFVVPISSTGKMSSGQNSPAVLHAEGIYARFSIRCQDQFVRPRGCAQIQRRTFAGRIGGAHRPHRIIFHAVYLPVLVRIKPIVGNDSVVPRIRASCQRRVARPRIGRHVGVVAFAVHGSLVQEPTKTAGKLFVKSIQVVRPHLVHHQVHHQSRLS